MEVEREKEKPTDHLVSRRGLNCLNFTSNHCGVMFDHLQEKKNVVCALKRILDLEMDC